MTTDAALERPRPPQSVESGFSVLEALVAMAILAAALLPLLALQGQFVRTTQSLERVQTRLSAESIALAHIKALNLDQSPEGTLSTVYGPMTWTSTPAAGPHAGRDGAGFPSRFVITLYDVDIEIASQTGTFQKFSLQGLGWHPTKSILDTL